MWVRPARSGPQLILWGCRQLGSLASRVEEYERLLEDLSTRVGDEDRARIHASIDKVWRFVEHEKLAIIDLTLTGGIFGGRRRGEPFQS